MESNTILKWLFIPILIPSTALLWTIYKIAGGFHEAVVQVHKWFNL